MLQSTSVLREPVTWCGSCTQAQDPDAHPSRQRAVGLDHPEFGTFTAHAAGGNPHRMSQEPPLSDKHL